MSTVTIVTGSPGTGKTTFSRLLAREDPEDGPPEGCVAAFLAARTENRFRSEGP